MLRWEWIPKPAIESATIDVVHKYKGRLWVLREERKSLSFHVFVIGHVVCGGITLGFVFVFDHVLLCVLVIT